jgi:hypothetical protein
MGFGFVSATAFMMTCSHRPSAGRGKRPRANRPYSRFMQTEVSRQAKLSRNMETVAAPKRPSSARRSARKDLVKM